MDSLDFRSASFFKTKNALYALATRLFPICRSITGEGFRTSLEILKEEFENGRKIGVIFKFSIIKSGDLLSFF